MVEKRRMPGMKAVQGGRCRRVTDTAKERRVLDWRDPVHPFGKGKSVISGIETSMINFMDVNVADGQLQSLTKSLVHNPCFKSNSNLDNVVFDELVLSKLKKKTHETYACG